MSDRIDAILDTIDEALSAEPTAVPVYEGVDTCDRCGVRSAHGEKCAGCRAFLLGDSEMDPRASASAPTRIVFDADPALTNESLDRFAGIVRRIFEQYRAAEMARWLRSWDDRHGGGTRACGDRSCHDCYGGNSDMMDAMRYAFSVPRPARFIDITAT